MINARAETVAEKPAFRVALKKRRCIIPADGFYEWTTSPVVGQAARLSSEKAGGKRAARPTTTVKQPFCIRLKTREPFGFAGLWERWTSPDGKEVLSCTIITTEVNELLKDVHHRMPVILPREAEAVWLDPKIQDVEKLLPLLKPYPSELMEFYPVSKVVNSPANDTPQCIEKVSV
jgi:putative SOS response-associated peptidase YedK